MIWIILSGFAFGSLGIFVKKIYTAGVSAHTTLSLRFIIATLIFAVLLVIQKKPKPTPPKTILNREIQTALLLGALGYAGFASCFMKALELLTASISVVLLYTYPVFVWIGERFVLKEKQSRNSGFMIPAAIIGVVFLSQSQSGSGSIINAENKLLGIFYGILSAILYAGYILTSRTSIQKTKSALRFSFFIHLGAAVVLLGSSILFYGVKESSIIFYKSFFTAPVEIIGLAAIPTVLAITLFLKGLKTTSSLKAAIGSATEPFSAVLLSVFLLGEDFGLYQLIGSMLILFALVSSFNHYKPLQRENN